MKVICLNHDEMMPMSKNPVSEAMKHLHWQLCEMSLKLPVANEWVKCEQHAQPAEEAQFHAGESVRLSLHVFR